METSVREGSDLWLTWQYTAQLCAKLLIEYNLPLNRLVGHHFFSGKDCPQPLLENDQQIWKIFLDMVETEYERMTKFEDYEFTFKAENSTYVHKYGLIKKWGAQAQSTGYTVTVSNGVTTETITLYTWIPAK